MLSKVLSFMPLRSVLLLDRPFLNDINMWKYPPLPLLSLFALPQVFGSQPNLLKPAPDMVSPLLFVTLILCLPSPGSLQSRSDWGRATGSRGRNVQEVDSGEAAVASEGSDDSLEGSGRSNDGAFWSGMTIPKRLQPNPSKQSGSATTSNTDIVHELRY